jgi:hypothetical protein
VNYGILIFNAVYFGDSPTFQKKISSPRSESKCKPSKAPTEAVNRLNGAGFWLGLVFDSEDENDTFLRNVCFSLNYIASQPRSPLSS